MERMKLLIATATGVRRCKSSNGITGSEAHLSSTNRKMTKRTAEVANKPKMIGLVHGYASTVVEFVFSETAINAAPTHPASKNVPSQSIRLISCIGVCLTAGVAVPEVGSDGTVYRTLNQTANPAATKIGIYPLAPGHIVTRECTHLKTKSQSPTKGIIDDTPYRGA